jgi:phosphoglycerate dehydrogenase-like enzyme
MVKNVIFFHSPSSYMAQRLNELEREFPEVKFIINPDPKDRLTLLKSAEAVVTGRLTDDELSEAKNLKIIFVPFTGLNNFPLNKLKERNISISNTHGNAKFVAEKAVALILALLGRVVEYHNELKKGYWFYLFDETDKWISIQDKTIGILGYGNIGRNIAKFLKGFGCRIVGFKKHIEQDCDEYADEISNDITKIIEQSDIIFISLPLNEETKGLISADVLSKMKGKYLVNIARGAIVNEESLYNALKDGTIAGAALDVWYNYPGKKNEPVFPSNKPIYELPNVVISPHKASNTSGSIKAMADETIDNIRNYLRMCKTNNLIDKEHYY